MVKSYVNWKAIFVVFLFIQPSHGQVFINVDQLPIFTENCRPFKKTSVDVNYSPDYLLDYSYGLLFVACTPKGAVPETKPTYWGMICNPKNIDDMKKCYVENQSLKNKLVLGVAKHLPVQKETENLTTIDKRNVRPSSDVPFEADQVFTIGYNVEGKGWDTTCAIVVSWPEAKEGQKDKLGAHLPIVPCGAADQYTDPPTCDRLAKCSEKDRQKYFSVRPPVAKLIAKTLSPTTTNSAYIGSDYGNLVREEQNLKSGLSHGGVDTNKSNATREKRRCVLGEDC